MGVERKEEHAFLSEFLKDFKNVNARIMNGINWDDEAGIQNIIASFDVGIATLLDNEFYRSKSAFKLKQYLNAGVPVLSSNLPENNKFIIEGSNGFLCNTSEELRQRIIQFYEMKGEEYKSFSKNARRCIHNFDLKHFCEKLHSICNLR